MTLVAYEWIDYDPDSGRVYADGQILPATRVGVVGETLDIEFALENGLYGSLSVTPSWDPEDRVLMSLCLIDHDRTGPGPHRVPAPGYYGVILHNERPNPLGFDARTVPVGEAWVVDEGHRYGVINENVETPTNAGEILALLAAWSSLRMVDKRAVDA